jgi:hypothetical protein
MQDVQLGCRLSSGSQTSRNRLLSNALGPKERCRLQKESSSRLRKSHSRSKRVRTITFHRHWHRLLIFETRPNQNGQSNMTPEEGVKLWKEYIEPMKAHGYKLCSPATSSAPNGYTWVEEFFKICGPDKCQVSDPSSKYRCL